MTATESIPLACENCVLCPDCWPPDRDDDDSPCRLCVPVVRQNEDDEDEVAEAE